MLISAAWAQDAATASTTAQSSGIMNLLPLMLIFVVFYFLLIRPQQKRFKEHQAMIGAIRRGDHVLTGGGIVGVVSKVETDDMLMVEIAPNVIVKVARSTVANVISRTGSTLEEAKRDGDAQRKEKAAANDR